MSFTLLKIMFKIGSVLSITPSSINITYPTIKEKIRVTAMATMYTLINIFSVYHRKTIYEEFIHVTLAVKIVIDLSIYVFTVYTLIASISKRSQWFFFLRNLKYIEISHKNEKLRIFCFVSSNIIYFLVMTSVTLDFTSRNGAEFYKQYALEYVQLYILFFISYLLSISVLMIRSCYHQVDITFAKGVKILSKKHLKQNYLLTVLNKIKNDLNILKETVDYFNDIFGWIFLLILIMSSCQIITSLDRMFNSSDHSSISFVSNSLFMLLLIVS